MTPNPNPNPIVSFEAVSFEAFRELSAQVAELKKTLNRLLSVKPVYISRKQAQLLLGCGTTKLWEITTRDKIIETSAGGRQVNYADCLSYLQARSVSAQEIEERINKINSRKTP